MVSWAGLAVQASALRAIQHLARVAAPDGREIEGILDSAPKAWSDVLTAPSTQMAEHPILNRNPNFPHD